MLTPYLDTRDPLPLIPHPQKLIDICSTFADQLISRKERMNYYQSERLISSDRFRDQLIFGKLAEFYVAKYLTHYYGLPLIEPDLIVGDSNSRRAIGFDADLIYGLDRLHIKSCEPNNYYTESYLFQKTDPAIDTATQDGYDWVALVVSGEGGAALRALEPISTLLPIFRPPQKESLKNQKVCIYREDLKQCPKNQK